MKKPLDFKVLKKNQYGHRWILEPKERIKFREKCKHRSVYGSCAKDYKCYVDDAVLFGCTPNVSCPRLEAWDKRHGLEMPYTIVENKYPDMKPTSFTWHPATESPGKKRVLIAFCVKGYESDHYTFSVIRFCDPHVTPATCAFETDNGTKKLAVAWAYYDEIAKGIASWMVKRAIDEAWPWWDQEENVNNKMYGKYERRKKSADGTAQGDGDL